MSGHTHSITGIARRSSRRDGRLTRALSIGVLAGGLLIAGFGPAVPSALAASTAAVNVGQASTYAVLSGASVGNTVNAAGAPFTTLRGDLGVMANAQPTGFPPGVVTGAVRVGTAVTQAYSDLGAAYGDVAGRTGGTPIAGDLGGVSLTPGLYSAGAAVGNTGTLTLDGGGNPNAVFVFQIGAALNMAAGARVKLINGASASRVFWQVDGAAAIGANAKFAGTIMALGAIAIGAGTEVNGRALALNGAISLDSNDFYSAPPVVTIAGGPTASTNDPTPTITGTTDVAAPAVVTVTIGGQTLTAIPSNGAWSLTSAILANATYPVVASVQDGAGNPGSATEQLTIDTVPPVVTIAGGASLTTNDPTRTIAGTSDVTQGTVVRVSVDSQSLTALVQAGGTWNVAPAPLVDGTHTVTVSVTDPAGNQSIDTQLLTVNTVAPAVTIVGGANALTNDPAPDISGTADVPPGTPVTVALADQTLTALVQSGGAWSVTTAFLSDGSHRVLISVADAAGNVGGAAQTLTVDTVSPVVTISGGATAGTNNVDPTVRGTSNAAPGTTVTVSIAQQTMTTLVQADGTWNATPGPVGDGTWEVVGSAADPAGNVGRATQILTVATGGSSGSVGPLPSGSGSPLPSSSGSPLPSSSVGPLPAGSGSQLPSGLGGPTGSGGPLLTVSLPANGRKTAQGKRVRVSFVVSAPAKVTLTVRRGKRVVARLSTTLRKAGHGSLTWSGKIKEKIAPRGVYKIMLRMVSPAGASASAASTLRIT